RAAGGLDRHLRQRPAVLLCRPPFPAPRARRCVRMGDDRGYVLAVRLARGRQARGIRARTGRCLCGVAGGGDRAISALPRLRGNQTVTPRMVVELSLMTSKPGAPPHQEEIDYEGQWCPFCEFWHGRDRFTGQLVN